VSRHIRSQHPGSASGSLAEEEERWAARIRAQGASDVTTIPAEVVRRMGATSGQELGWIEDGLGGFRVVRHTPDLAKAMEAHEEIMAEYDAVFRQLAK
jgi:putative addiction module antidote